MRRFAEVSLIILLLAVCFSAAASVPRFTFAGPMGDEAVSQDNGYALADGSRLEVGVVDTQPTPELPVTQRLVRFKLLNATAPRVLKEVVLDEIPLNGAAIRLMDDGRQSYPAFVGDKFYGIEFPIAAVRVENDKVLLAYRPGLRVEPDTPYETHKAVSGTDFESYILSRRPKFDGMHVNYNSWWTSPAPYYTEKDILDLMETFRVKLYEPHRIAFNTFCIDMGWSNPKTLWEIDPKLFPDGFNNIELQAMKMDCALGLWISPSSLYPSALDNQWAKDNGYEAGQKHLCLGGRKYREAFRDRLVEMVTKYNISHIKLDGYVPVCEETDHGHEPGVYSADAIAQGIIDAAVAVHEASPNTWLEPTGFGFNPSPWWLLYFNSVIGSFGDDAPRGRVPAPVYRESYTTARDYYNLQGAYWNPCPAAGQEVLGIIHQTPDSFLNDAVMTIGRGHQFLPLYVNPKYMQDDDWRKLAGLLQPLNVKCSMPKTRPILPKSWENGACPKFTHDATMPREPYGYVTSGTRGMHATIVLRNPWIARTEVKLTLDEELGVPKDATEVGFYGWYPQHRSYIGGHRYGDEVTIPLAPYETLQLNMTIGKIYCFGTLLPPLGANHVLDGHLTLSNATQTVRKVAFDGEAFGPDWTSTVGDTVSALDVSATADVETDVDKSVLLVLLENPRKAASGIVQVSLNGQPAEARLVCDSTTGWSATGDKIREFWQFYETKLPSGRTSVAIKALAADPDTAVSAWAVAKMKNDGQHAGLPGPDEIYLDSAPVFDPVSAASVEGEPVHEARPVEKINGIYLDALEPVSATQGYGKLEKNRSVWEKPMTIAGKRFQRGIGTHAPAKIVYNLDGKYAAFQAFAGADGATAPTVTFEVWVDGQKRWESGLMQRDDPAKEVKVDVTGAKKLELVVGDGGNGLNADHADWADAKLLR